MHRNHVLGILIGLLKIGVLGSPALAQPAPGNLVPSRQHTFAIPFQVDGVRNAGQMPAEVQLFVSDDAGANWRLEARIDPSQGKFLFRAPHDGEYWFGVRSIGRDGQVLPGPETASLKVLVDTVQPQLEMTATASPGGVVQVQWSARDENLSPESVKLQYQMAANGPWRDIPSQAAPSQVRGLIGGAPQFQTGVTQGSIAVRAEVADRCGNQASAQAMAHFSSTSLPPLARNAIVPTNSLPHFDGSIQWPADQDTLAANPADPAGATSVISPHHPGRVYPANMSAKADSSWSSAPSTSGGKQTQYLRTPTFELDYEVASAGPPGVSKVELWGTFDEGHTWSLVTTDADRQSPVPVRVSGDGTYGFRIVITLADGRSQGQPKSGDAPEMWITVDQQEPLVKLTAAVPQTQAGTHAIDIAWQAQDAKLTDRPISLHYAVQPNGPWQPIATSIENSGRYTWSLADQTPLAVYLQVSAQDAAGNVGTAVSTQPISIHSAPSGTLRSVRPHF